jgi:hypothetical protein
MSRVRVPSPAPAYPAYGPSSGSTSGDDEVAPASSTQNVGSNFAGVAGRSSRTFPTFRHGVRFPSPALVRTTQHLGLRRNDFDGLAEHDSHHAPFSRLTSFVARCPSGKEPDCNPGGVSLRWFDSSPRLHVSWKTPGAGWSGGADRIEIQDRGLAAPNNSHEDARECGDHRAR